MLLEELQVEGFRSLKSVTWKPGRLNVLIGPNGGGKSNLLRAMDLLRVAAMGGLRQEIIRLGGMVPLVWDGRAEAIKFASTLTFSELDSIRVKYEFRLDKLGNAGSFVRNQEYLRRLDGVAASSRMLLPASSLGTLKETNTETLLSQFYRIEGLGPEPIEILLRTKTFHASWALHNEMRVDQDAELRRATVTRSEKRVDPNGQNLIAVLHTLYENDRQFEEFLDSSMAAAFPDDYEKLSFPPAEHGRTEMRVRRKHRKMADSPADLSDGTLRFLLLLTILGSPDPAPLIAIDEPETGLHPRMLRIIAEVAADAALKTQVIFSTHSPEFLDAFGDEPPTTTVVTSNGSESELRTVGGDALKRWIENYRLGKFAFSGEAEAVL